MSRVRELFDAFKGELDLAWLMSNTEELWRIELGQTFRDHRRSSKHVERLMKASGLHDVERIVFPADGKTAYQDKAMPLAWDVKVARLTVTKSPVSFEDPVVADYDRHPFHVVRGSVRTPKGGVAARLVTEDQMYAGVDVRGAMVIARPETRVRREVLSAVCDLGALGFVTDNIKCRYATPDGVAWINGCSEDAGWHVHDDDRPFIGFSVSPRVGDQLRQAAQAGVVEVHVESDGRRYEGEIDLVTGVLPGQDPRELWLLGHLYEPLPNDNSAGTVAAIEIARAIQRMVEAGRLPRPRFSLRLVFGLEMYGFAAYADRRGGDLSGQVIGGMNMDAQASTGEPSVASFAPAGARFFGDYAMEELFRATRGEPDMPFLTLRENGGYSDDTLLSDPTVGLPTLWPQNKHLLWHNSEQRMNVMYAKGFFKAVCFSGAWIAHMLTLEGDVLEGEVLSGAALAEEHVSQEANAALQAVATAAPEQRPALAAKADGAMALRRRLEEGRLEGLGRLGAEASARKAAERVGASARRAAENLKQDLKALAGDVDAPKAEPSVWEKMARAIVPARGMVGFPHDIRRVPKRLRRPLPGSIIYSPFGHVVANMDGKKTLEELVFEAEWETRSKIGPADLRDYIGAIELLSEYGYLNTEYRKSVSQADIVAAARRIGVEEGDLVMLHSGLASLGHVEGGADALIDAMLEAVGPKGTLLLPTFTRSTICVGNTPQRNGAFRPYHPQKSKKLWTGRVPEVFLERKGVFRSAHPTHSAAGIGPLAEACLGEHRENDPPVNQRSPFGQIAEHGGKMVWLGADLASTTMLHLFETEMDAPWLEDALCRVERPDGRLETVHVPGYLPGHRDFYRRPGEETKAYRRMIEAGLKIRVAPVGFGHAKLIRADEMRRLGMAAMEKDPNLLLCDNEDCRFCSMYRV